MATIGIDLGTSYSMVSYWNGEKSEIIKNVFGKNLTPSIIGIDDENNEILIGDIARERLISKPENTISSFKRFIGTNKKYNIGKLTFTPVELSSLLLKNLKDDAENYLKEECKDAIISVPAYFNNKQREDTKLAAKLAGLNVLNLISEPTAAAIAYGLEKDLDSTILVLDLGGGTFDVSLLEIFEGIIQVNAISGDNNLGGDDFTEVIVNDFLNETNLKDEILNIEFISILRKRCEELKKKLIVGSNEEITINYKNRTFNYSLNYSKYEKLVEKLLDKMKMPIVKVIKDTNTSLSEIDKIILIGGSTKAEVVRKYVTKLFGKFPYTNINPDEAVGIGAGIQAALKLRDKKLSEVILTDVCAYSLGIETSSRTENAFINGIFSPIIERNSTIPISIVKRFSKLYDEQKVINVSIYQGESNKVSDNLFLGRLNVPVKKDEEEIDIRFTYDGDGILEVDVNIVGTKKQKNLIIEEKPGNLSKIEIEKILNKLESLKIHPRDKSENKYLLEKAKRIYMETIGEKREYIGKLITDFEITLEKQIPKEIEKKSEKFNEILNSFEREIF